MSRIETITRTLYTYDELPNDKAKEKARDWFRSASEGDEYWDSVYDDAVTIAALFGLDISTYTQKWHVMGRDGKPGRDGQSVKTSIFFSGFWSQGDGACFEGEYRYKADALEAVKGYAATDETLHSIVADLQAAQAEAGNRVAFTIKHSGHYYHERSMNMEVLDSCYETDEGERLPESDWLTHEQTKAVEECLIRFAKWIYRQLEKEYEYQTSDEAVADNIRNNDYEFTEDGERA